MISGYPKVACAYCLKVVIEAYNNVSLNFIFTDDPYPQLTPMRLKPCFDAEVLKKVQVTINKVALYLDKAGAAEWWKDWLDCVSTNITPQDPEPLPGMTFTCCLFVCLFVCLLFVC